MSNPITRVIFGERGYPRRIEEDPMFLGWSRDLPRLWYLDQRQATRLDAESLFGASQFAIFYARSETDTVATPVDVGVIAGRGFARSATTAVNVPIESVTRTINLFRTLITVLAAPTQAIHITRPTGSPVDPPVHPATGADQLIPSELAPGPGPTGPVVIFGGVPSQSIVDLIDASAPATSYTTTFDGGTP